MPRDILAIVPDLFFAARIREVALATGATLREAAPAAAVDAVRARMPGLVIVDLHGTDDPAGLIRALREAAPDLAVVGFHSHVDTAIREAALGAGATEVLPRSAFTRRLAAMLAAT
jgi:DNA-binding NarL/FixJ family response regulator